MKNVKVKVALLALVLGISAALATAAPQSLVNKKWGLLPDGAWTDVTGQAEDTDYECDESGATCTAEYPAAVNPNNQAGDSYPGIAQPQSIVTGEFSN